MNQRFYCLFLVTFLSLFINTLFSAPNITNLTPYKGDSTGGTVVTITGNGFSGATAVDFGGTPALSFTVHSDNLITATSPLHSPEVIFVTVIAPSGTSPLTSDAYFVYLGDGFAYIVNNDGGTVSVIDTASNTAVATLTVGTLPIAIAITPDGTKAYVSNAQDNTVSVIDTASNTVVVTLTVGTFPTFIAITPDGEQAYVVNESGSTVSVIDTTFNTVVATPAVGALPVVIAITPDGMTAYVSNFNDNTVSIINTTSFAVTPVPVGTFPTFIAITPDGEQAYVINEDVNNVSVMNTTSNTVVATPAVGVGPSGIAIAPDGSNAYVANILSNSVSIINTTSFVVTSVLVGSRPRGIAISPNGSNAYVLNSGTASNSVSVINLTSNSVVATLAVGTDPAGIAITPDGAKVFVTNTVSNDVSIINTAFNTVVTTSVGAQPTFIAIAADQAPLSRFTVTIAPAGSPSTFDASLSESPVGNFKNYFWDFGDGNTENTAFPMIMHTYAVPGNYTVTLTVTNSAGTSTSLIFNPSSGIANSTSLTNNGGPSAMSSTMITVPFGTPIITGLNPNSGSICGGTSVTINGMNFSDAIAVLFGSTLTSSFIVNSDTSITAVSPPGTTGIVDVRVITPGGESVITPADQFTYLAPTVTGIQPNSGPTCGGTSVTITGTNFSCATAVLFGSTFASSFTINSDTSITAVSPPETPGTVDIRVMASGGISEITPADQFTYHALTITGIQPNSGSTCGGTSVTITGTDFTCATAVLFGSTPASSFTINSDTSITAISPPGMLGTVDIRVIASGVISEITPADQFTYLSVTITGIEPNSGPTCGGTSVTITGTNFSCATAVLFGSTFASSFTINSDTSITAVSPPETPGTVDIRVMTSGGISEITPADQFTYHGVLAVSVRDQ